MPRSHRFDSDEFAEAAREFVAESQRLTAEIQRVGGIREPRMRAALIDELDDLGQLLANLKAIYMTATH